jgi:protein O-GlcNAc transferase
VNRAQHPSSGESKGRPEALAAGVASVFAQALAAHRQGALERAGELYREVLLAQPNHPTALHMLGVVAVQSGQGTAGVELIRRSLAIDPHQVGAHSALGNALRSVQRTQEALGSYERALQLDANHVPALSNQSDTLLELGRPQEALASYERLLRLKPDHLSALYNRGEALLKLQRTQDALGSYERAMQVNAQCVPALCGRGNALLVLNRPLQALESFERVLQLKADEWAALAGKGKALRDLKRLEEALQVLERCVQLAPQNAQAHHNHGTVLWELHRDEEALESYERALQLDPAFAPAYHSRGSVLLRLERHAEALAYCDKALQLDPMSADARFGRGVALAGLGRNAEAAESLENTLRIRADFPYAKGSLIQARLDQCDWREWEAAVEALDVAAAEGARASVPFTFLATSDSAGAQLNCAREYARDCFPAIQPPLWSGERWEHRRLRIAYVSADFREHPVSQLLAGVLEHHDRERFEILALSLWKGDRGALGRRVETAVERFMDVSAEGDVAVAHLIQQQQVDLVVDLQGFTLGSRPGIFARRPAPLQATYLGFAGTMGSEYIDYLIADRVTIPSEARAHYAERIVWLPHSYLPYDNRQGVAERTLTRAEMGLPEEGVVFCAFNNPYKLNPPLFEIWMRLLRELPGSVLWLRSANERVMGNLRQEAVARGVEAHRMVFATALPSTEEHLARQRLADLFLDTLPYNAHATAINALWVGLPVLTCRGSTFAGRVGASLLEALGLRELITESLEEYERRALELARDPQRLAEIRAKLARQTPTAPLFDTARFCRHLESAYQQMCGRHRCGAPPEHFSVFA